MKRLVLSLGVVGLVLAGMPSLLLSQEFEQELLKCAETEDNASRLECYDRLAESLGGANEKPRGHWGVNHQKDPIKDTRIITLYLPAANTNPPAPKPVFLFLRCREGATTAYVSWNKELASPDVLVRYEDKEATRVPWNVSSDNEASFYPGDVVAFIKGLMETQVFTVQVNPKDEVPLTAVFDVSGLAEAVLPLREECGW